MNKGNDNLYQRLYSVRGGMEKSRLGALLVTAIENVRYLSGFTGSSAALVITPDDAWLVTDGRYREQAAGESRWNVVIYDDAMTTTIARLLRDSSPIGFEESIRFGLYLKLREALGDSRKLEPATGLIEQLRCRKDGGEVSFITGAIHCACLAFSRTLHLAKPGVTERELAAELDYRMMLAGADGSAFDTVVASGPNSSLPHAGITDRVLAPGDLVVIDFGAVKDGYRSDMTRTVPLGPPGSSRLRALDAVSGALEAALTAVSPGVQARDVDLAARKHIEECGFGGSFLHGLGHGVGLEVHEKPSLSSKSPDTLEPGMVFTLEPGVYIEGRFGVRIEEMVHLTPEGPVVLTDRVPARPLSGESFQE